MAVEVQQVLDFLGRPEDRQLSRTIEEAVPVIETMVRAYTRGRGFDSPEPEIDAVILTATARLVTNTGQLPIDETAGPYSRSIRGAFVGWTTGELAVLNRYRVRAR